MCSFLDLSFLHFPFFRCSLFRNAVFHRFICSLFDFQIIVSRCSVSAFSFHVFNCQHSTFHFRILHFKMFLCQTSNLSQVPLLALEFHMLSVPRCFGRGSFFRHVKSMFPCIRISSPLFFSDFQFPDFRYQLWPFNLWLFEMFLLRRSFSDARLSTRFSRVWNSCLDSPVVVCRCVVP